MKKHIHTSIRTKTMLLTLCAILVAVTITTLLGVSAIKTVGSEAADRTLLQLCMTGDQSLDAYFQSVEQSVEMVSAMVEEDLHGVTPDRLEEHMSRVEPVIERMAEKTSGVLTYYYRIDPAVSDTVTGFWFANLDGRGFQEQTVTDLTKADTEDTSHVVWFTVPKFYGRAVWLRPYLTDGLNIRVISYNHPIYDAEGRFIGVVGMEIDYNLLADMVNYVSLDEGGYAYIIDEEGRIVCHPTIDVAALGDDYEPSVPQGLMTGETFVNYTYNGVEMRAAVRGMNNGMRIVVTVPVSKINESWRRVIREILISVALLLVLVSFVTLRFTGHIIKPLQDLTDAAQQINNGNYDIKLEYEGNDEVGILTNSVNQLIQHLKVYISDLNSLAYADALTHVRNKGAYDICVRKLQADVSDSNTEPHFAMAVFDCDGLKSINDRYGHDKGDLYLKAASHLICHVFLHSPVFRTGGDEFTAILKGEDYSNREILAQRFQEECARVSEGAQHRWEEIHVSMGLASYDPTRDESVSEVARRADKLMYQEKRSRKHRTS